MRETLSGESVDPVQDSFERSRFLNVFTTMVLAATRLARQRFDRNSGGGDLTG